MKRKLVTAIIAWFILLVPLRADAAGDAEPFSLELTYGEVAQAALDMQEQTAAAAVRTAGHNVRVDNRSDPDADGLIYKSEGSGVIMKVDEYQVYIATAAHCLKHANTFVEFADGTVHQAYMAYRNVDTDVGFLLVPCAGMEPQTFLSILPAAGADVDAIAKKSGDPVFAVSSSAGPNSLILPGFLDEASVVYPNNPEQNVIQFFSMASFGSSGGGLYSMEGVWLGNVSGGDTYGKCWAVPYGDIMREYQVWMAELAQQAAAWQENGQPEKETEAA